ncbi:MAG: MFS transporter, partial [Dongiaceae bacterium]
FTVVALFGLGTIVFGLSTSFWLSLAALVLLGGADMVSVFIRSTLIPLATPDPMRGRVTAVEMVFIGASNELGAFESGVAAALLGTVPAVVFGGVATLVVVALWIRWFPELYRVDRLDQTL